MILQTGTQCPSKRAFSSFGYELCDDEPVCEWNGSLASGAVTGVIIVNRKQQLRYL